MPEDARVTAARWSFNHHQHFKSIPPRVSVVVGQIAQARGS